MEQINLDSDCEIQDPEISLISLTDSQDDLEETKPAKVVDEYVLLDTDVEEGEVDEEEPPPAASIREAVPVFEINFPQLSDFQKLGHQILSVLRKELNGSGAVSEAYKFTIVGADSNSEQVSMRAFAVEATEVPPSTAAQEETVEEGEQLNDDCNISTASSTPDLSVDLNALFTIDTAPAAKLDTVKVPSYKRAVREVLDDESAQRKKLKIDDVDKCRRPRQSAACFNCGSSEHAIRDCTKPRNNKRINRAKKAFSTKQERYHVDIEQRFAHLRPGVISSKLQSALGLRRGELPFFFYRMRVMGYPPGWLEDAKVAHSGIALFNSDGTEVLKPDECEGEIDGMDHKYDINKIVEFPGFNSDPGPNFYDDYKHHNVPPLSVRDMKDEFIKTLGDNIIKGYKRKKLKDLPAAANESANEIQTNTLEVADMDIEDSNLTAEGNVIFTRPLPPPEPPTDEKAPPPPPPPTPPPTIVEEISQPSTITTASASSPSSEERSQSPTLADLEEQQLKLLHELQGNASNISLPADDSLIDEVLALEENTQTTQSSLDESLTKPQNTDEPPQSTPDTPTTPIKSKRDTDVIFKESHMGTPLLKFSPFDKLPAGDNFKVGVSDVINFENLPDSTGKYEQMKEVIKKVRKIVTKLHNDDDDE